MGGKELLEMTNEVLEDIGLNPTGEWGQQPEKRQALFNTLAERIGITADEYQTLAARTANDNNLKSILDNCALGLAGESGEFADLIKKHVYHGHELDKEKLLKELGDVAWYIARACTALDVDLSDVLEANIEKLKARYPNGFSSEASKARVDVALGEWPEGRTVEEVLVDPHATGPYKQEAN